MGKLAVLAVLLVGKATLSFSDVGIVAGVPSTAKVSSPAARVVFTNGASRASVRARARRSTVRFVLPRAGAWRYRVLVRGRVAATGSVRARAANLPGARPHAACAAGGAFWPSMTFAADFGSLLGGVQSQSRTPNPYEETCTGRTEGGAGRLPVVAT
jgi:hypothetical protein